MNETRLKILSSSAFASLLLFAVPAEAQLYIPFQYPATYVPLTSGAPITFVDTDEGASIIPIGFPFVYYGQTYDYVNVGVNGGISFAPACSSANPCLQFDETCNANNVCERDSFGLGGGTFPVSFDQYPMVAPFWDDLVIDSLSSPRATIRSAVVGTAPNRELVIEWANIRHYGFFGGAGSLSIANFQVRLAESSGAVRFAYGPYVPNALDNSDWSGSIGMQNATATEGINPVTCGGFACDYTVLQALNGQIVEISVPNAPELLGDIASPTGADPGATISVPMTIRNIGPQPTGASFTADLYLSMDTTITPGIDTYLGSLTFGDLAAQSSTTATLVTTLSSTTPPGLYRIGAIIDPANTVTESVETNNVALAQGVFLVGYDVSVAMDPIPATGPNESVTFPIRILNNGSALPAVDYEVYLSADQTLDASDVLLAFGTTAVPAQPQTTITVTATVPTMIPGDYYALAVVDPHNLIIEADESNNFAAAETTTELAGPDVVAANVDGGPFAFRGETYLVTATIRNAGLSRATDFYYSLHLSANNLITFTDPLLGEFGPVTLEPGEQIVVTQSVTIDPTLAAGEYYLGLIADSTSQILEQLENNNVSHRRDKITVRDPAPDLSASGIQLQGQAAAGESMVIARTLSNTGNAPAMASYAIYFTADQMLDKSNDILVASGMITLAAGEDDRGVDRVRVPASVPAGRYFVAYVMDPDDAISEVYETDNVTVSTSNVDVLASQLSIATRTLPIATLHVPYELALAATGAAGGVTWSVTNGALPPGLTLSSSGFISGTPTREGTFPLTITANDGALSASVTTTMLVAEQSIPLEIATRAVIPAFIGRAYEFPLTAIGGVPPYTWIARDALPAGITLSPDGVLSGTPRQAGVATVNFRVTDLTGTTADRPIVVRAINSDAAVRFSADVLPDGMLGEQYSASLHVEPGTGASPYTFELAGGTMPPGLALENDQVQGVPTAVGDFAFEIRLKDSRGDFDVNLFVVTIRESAGVAITTTSLPKAMVGTEYLDENGAAIRVKAFAASMQNAVITFALVGGELPPGLTLANDGLLSGTPTMHGVYSFLVEAKDSAGQVDHRALGLLVEEAPVVPPVVTEDDGCTCVAGSKAGAGALGSMAALLVCGLGLVLRSRASRRGLALLAGLLSLAALAPRTASAQSVPYFFSSGPSTYVPRTGGTAISFNSPFGGGVNLDDGIATLTLPFAFHYFDADYTSVTASSNGYVTFLPASSAGVGGQPIPSVGEPDATIALFWDDLVVTGGSTYVDGTAPNRVFVIQWDGVTHYPSSSNYGTTSFQLWLYEGLSGRFEVHYGPATNVNGTAWSNTSGFEDETGTVGFNLLACGSNCVGADLIAAQNTVITVQQDAGDEVVAQTITAPQTVYAGIAFDIATTLASQHQAPLGPFAWQIHLLAANETVPNNPIFTSGPTTLSPYQVLQTTTSTAVPLSTPPGRYRLALVVDSTNAIAEPNETNNVVLSNEIRVEPQQPDFRVASVTPSVTASAPGSSFTVDLGLTNAGNLDGTAQWTVYLSRNAVVSADDLQLASGTASLPLLATQHVTANVTLPASLAAGTYYVGAIVDPDNLVGELNEVNNSGVATERVVLTSGSVNIETSALPKGYAGVAYSTYLTAMGGNGAYTWNVSGGALPTGFTLVPTTGELRGRATTPTSATFTVQVTSGAQMATKQLTLEIGAIEAGLTIVTRELLPGIVGDAYPPAEAGTEPALQQHLLAIGGTSSVTFSLMSTPPPGLVLDADGWIHGTPVNAGVFDLAVSATDGTQTATRSISLTVTEPGRVRLVAAVLPNGRLGENYDYQLRVVGAAPGSSVVFEAVDALPPGLTLTSAGGLTGNPTAIGNFTFTISVAAMPGAASLDTAVFRLVIEPDVGFRITPTTLAGATVGVEYEQVFEAVGGTPPFVWQLEGPTPPRGLMTEKRVIDSREQLAIVGTPEVADFVTELLIVTDAVGRRATLPISISVLEPPAPPKPKADSGCSCAAAGATSPTAGGFGLLFVLGLALFARIRTPGRRRVE